MTTEELLTLYNRKSEQGKFAICFHAFEWWITQGFSGSASDSYLEEKVYDTILNEDWDRVKDASAKYRIPAIGLLYIKEDRLKEGYEAEMKNEASVRGSLKLLFKGIMEGGHAYISVETKTPDIDGGVGNSIINLLIGHLMLQKSPVDAKNESKKVAIAITTAISNNNKNNIQGKRYNGQLEKYETSVSGIAVFKDLKLVTVPAVTEIPTPLEPTEPTREELDEILVEKQRDMDKAEEQRTNMADSINGFTAEFIEMESTGITIDARSIAALAKKYLSDAFAVKNRKAINKILG